MISKEDRENLQRLVKGAVLFDELMKNHTSFQIGGPAEALVMPRDDTELMNILVFCRKHRTKLLVIGNGTKLLIGDHGFDGIIVKISGCLNSVFVSGNQVVSGAGHSLSSLSRLVADHHLSGLEFSVGIPGTIGGAIFMNAGAHGCMMSDVVTEVTSMDFQGNVSKFQKGELRFGYRQSRFQTDACIILSAKMCLAESDVTIIRERMDRYIGWRREKQPHGLPNAGSVFKNPDGTSAGKLIEMVGLKGLRIGDAQISKEHANFILNVGNASAKDVIDLMKRAQREVLGKCGVLLEPEIRIMGRFS